MSLLSSVVSAKFHVTNPTFSCRNNKGDSLAASYYHLVNVEKNTAVGAEVTHSFSSKQNTVTFGTQHALDSSTTVKARYNSNSNSQRSHPA